MPFYDKYLVKRGKTMTHGSLNKSLDLFETSVVPVVDRHELSEELSIDNVKPEIDNKQDAIPIDNGMDLDTMVDNTMEKNDIKPETSRKIVAPAAKVNKYIVNTARLRRPVVGTKNAISRPKKIIDTNANPEPVVKHDGSCPFMDNLKKYYV